MGNKLVRRRLAVDEKYTKPQGLYQHKDVDHKKLRKLILDSKLAPCYPGDDDSGSDLEECPICFLYYPSLNRSRCCTKGICTECFLQMKTPGSTRPTQCPFCKTADYAVEYRGVKTKEEKGLEQIEEQRVIEAKIRMQQQEIQDEEGRKQKRRDTSSSRRTISPGEVGYDTVAGEEIVSSQEPCPSMRQSLCPRQDRDDEFDLDFEDIMVMEAIWLSIQENGRHRHPTYGDSVPSESYMTDMPPLAESSSLPSEGLARAIAVLAERQQIGGESSANYNGDLTTFNILEEQETERGRLAMRTRVGEWAVVDHGSEVAEVGTSSEDGGRILSSQDENEGSFQAVGGPIVPDNFEEQMMLAMAVSLADARAMTTASGVAWQ